MIFFHLIAGSYYKPRLRQHLHLYHHLRSTHLPPSPTTSKYPLIPNHHHPPNDHGPHRCNPSSPNATSRTTSTLGNLSMFFEMMQPDNRLSPTPFSEIRDLFRNNPRSETSRGTSRSKRQMNPKREWCQMGWIN